MSVFEAAIGLLAPAQCINCGLEGLALCADCKLKIPAYGAHCWRCNALSPGGRTCPKCRIIDSPAYVWVGTNYDGISRDLLRLYKFGHQRVAAEPIAQLMADTFLKYSENQRAVNYLIVPVPTATSRVRQRGFGHAELLAKKVAHILKFDRTNALRRLGQSRQVGTSRQHRLMQLSGNFAVKDPEAIYGRNIILIDDVVTTGGTITAATKALRAAGARQVNALLFAKRL